MTGLAAGLAEPESLMIKPSLRAAASTFAKVVGVLALAFSVPVLVAWTSGRGADVFAAVLAAQFGFTAALPAALTLLVPALRLAATRYDLDLEGVRVHSSIIARSDQRVPWEKVTLLIHRRTLVDRLLGIETVTVIAYGLRGATLQLVGLRDAAVVRDFAARRMRASASVASLFAND
jgi:uncharacterized membrane protein YdbT with pleckstrin-like domain